MKKTAQWIWYNGDYEIMQLNDCLTSRYERDVFIPPFWRMDDYYHNVKFVKEFSLEAAEEITILTTGRSNVIIDKKDAPENAPLRNFTGKVTLAAGSYILTVSVYNESGLPALYVDGRTLKSDGSFLVTCNDFRYVNAGCDGLTDPAQPPARFRFSYEKIKCKVLAHKEGSVMLDCGREMRVKLSFPGQKKGTARIYYGESVEEALDTQNCELTDTLEFSKNTEVEIAKACRYLYVECPQEAEARMEVYRQYHPVQCRSHFECSDEMLNEIYRVSLDTLALNTCGFYLDGIKRDRWVWSGDSYQCYLMSYYSFFDRRTIERTICALAGKRPVDTFINHIMDYSFLWIIALWDYYIYIGDLAFLARMLPMAKEIVSFSLTRQNPSGLLEGKPCDWVFLDWANLDNRGEVSAEQILFWKSLDVVGKLCGVLGEDGSKYFALRDEVERALIGLLWDGERGVFRYSRRDGVPNTDVKKHAHIFALLFGLFKDGRVRCAERVLTDENVEKIVTPYMRFFELDALCGIGQKDYVLHEIRTYWGGMLREGATSFWERYDPTEKGSEKYAMYGRPYGKSLCHAWGAGPLYLIGKYFAGLEPAEPGYRSFRLTPFLGDLEWMECELPAGEGTVSLRIDGTRVSVYSDRKEGKLYLDSSRYRAEGKPENGYYVFPIKAGERLEVGISKVKTEECV